MAIDTSYSDKFKKLSLVDQRRIENLPRAQAKAEIDKILNPKPDPKIETTQFSKPVEGVFQPAGSTNVGSTKSTVTPVKSSYTSTSTAKNKTSSSSNATKKEDTTTGTGTGTGNQIFIIDKTKQTAPINEGNYTQGAPLRSGAELAELFGLTIDPDLIEAKFNAATKGQYDMLRKEFGNTENKFYDRLYDTQRSLSDTLRRSGASVVSTGASRGVQAANERLAAMGLSQTATDDSTQLAQDRNLLADKEAGAYLQNAVDAFNQTEKTRQTLGNLSSVLNANDIQALVGFLDSEARKYTADQQAAAQKDYNSAYSDAALMNLLGVFDTNATNYKSTGLTVDANKEMNTERITGDMARTLAEIAGRMQQQGLINEGQLANTKAAASANSGYQSATGTQNQDFFGKFQEFIANPTPENLGYAYMLALTLTGGDIEAAKKLVDGMITSQSNGANVNSPALPSEGDVWQNPFDKTPVWSKIAEKVDNAPGGGLGTNLAGFLGNLFGTTMDSILPPNPFKDAANLTQSIKDAFAKPSTPEDTTFSSGRTSFGDFLVEQLMDIRPQPNNIPENLFNTQAVSSPASLIDLLSSIRPQLPAMPNLGADATQLTNDLKKAVESNPSSTSPEFQQAVKRIYEAYYKQPMPDTEVQKAVERIVKAYQSTK